MATVREEFEAVMRAQPLWQNLTPWEVWVLASKAMQERCDSIEQREREACREVVEECIRTQAHLASNAREALSEASARIYKRGLKSDAINTNE